MTTTTTSTTCGTIPFGRVLMAENESLWFLFSFDAINWITLRIETRSQRPRNERTDYGQTACQATHENTYTWIVCTVVVSTAFARYTTISFNYFNFIRWKLSTKSRRMRSLAFANRLIIWLIRCISSTRFVRVSPVLLDIQHSIILT